MSRLPRLAVGAWNQATDLPFLMWGLYDLLERDGVRVQAFLGQARFPRHDGARAVTGRSYRQLDSWIMSPTLCRDSFTRAARNCDVAIVEGGLRQDAAGRSLPSSSAGGSLEQLCELLDLPRLVVLDVSQLPGSEIPPRPSQVDGVLLAGLADELEWVSWRTNLEAVWGVPVLGGLDRAPALRAEAERLPAGQPPPRSLCRAIGERLARTLRLPELRRLADRSYRDPLPTISDSAVAWSPAGDLTVAVAYDEAFHAHFPDTLDRLEEQGAKVRDFSPLRSPELPPQTDLVYLGCGHAEWFAEQLAANHCLKQSIHRYAAQGGRIYAECAGAAYLCRQLHLADGRAYSMVGALPAVAHQASPPPTAQAVETWLEDSSWLGQPGLRLRGYRNGAWTFEPHHGCRRISTPSAAGDDLFADQQVVASRLHLNFAAQPALLDACLQPARAALPTAALR